ncbi:MAG: hypothetical protein IJ105_04355 [Bacilli bacterium]|nr:hypothetical protein [Bacilli bacterium]
MENKKKNNTAVIIIVVVLAILLFFVLVGFGGYYVYNKVIKPTTTEIKGDNSTPTTNDSTSSKSNSTSSKDATASTKESPLAIGDWGLASKYAGKYLDEEYADKTYIDVPVRVTKVSRGDKIINEVKKSLEEHHYKYEEPKSSQLEWAIVEYEVDLSDVKFGGSLGTNIKIDSSVKGTDGGSVKYDGITYILSTVDASSSDYVKEPGVYKGKFLTQLPKGCSDYLIKLGNSYNGAESYFKGE